jgi:hypothetical protein
VGTLRCGLCSIRPYRANLHRNNLHSTPLGAIIPCLTNAVLKDGVCDHLSLKKPSSKVAIMEIEKKYFLLTHACDYSRFMYDNP